MRLSIILLLLVFALPAMAQRTLITDKANVRQELELSGTSVEEIDTLGDFSGATHLQLPTRLGVRNYVENYPFPSYRDSLVADSVLCYYTNDGLIGCDTIRAGLSSVLASYGLDGTGIPGDSLRIDTSTLDTRYLRGTGTNDRLALWSADGLTDLAGLEVDGDRLSLPSEYALGMPGGPAAARPVGEVGDLWYNTDTEVLEYWDGVQWVGVVSTPDFPAANEVLYSDGSTVSGNSGFVYDATNNRIGLGDSTPDWAIDIEGDSTAIRIPVGGRPQAMPAPQSYPENGAIRIDTATRALQYGYVPEGLTASAFGRWVTQSNENYNRAFEKDGRLYYGHHEEAPFTTLGDWWGIGSPLILQRYWSSKYIRLYSSTSSNATFYQGITKIRFYATNDTGSRGLDYGFGNLADSSFTAAVTWNYDNVGATFRLIVAGVGTVLSSSQPTADRQIEIEYLYEIDSFDLKLLNPLAGDTIHWSGRYPANMGEGFSPAIRVRPSNIGSRSIYVTRVERFTSLDSIDLNAATTGRLTYENGLQSTGDTIGISADSIAAWSEGLNQTEVDTRINTNYGQGIYLSDQDSTLVLTSHSVVVTAAISASPGQEYSIIIPDGTIYGQTITIVESDANDADSYVYNVAPASGSLYGPDNGVVGTTTLTNESITLKWMPIDGTFDAWHIVSQHQ